MIAALISYTYRCLTGKKLSVEARVRIVKSLAWYTEAAHIGIAISGLWNIITIFRYALSISLKLGHTSLQTATTACIAMAGVFYLHTLAITAIDCVDAFCHPNHARSQYDLKPFMVLRAALTLNIHNSGQRERSHIPGSPPPHNGDRDKKPWRQSYPTSTGLPQSSTDASEQKVWVYEEAPLPPTPPGYRNRNLEDPSLQPRQQSQSP